MALGGFGIPLDLKGLLSNAVTLLAGAKQAIPSGSFLCAPGPYTQLEFLDPVSGLWRTVRQQTPNAVTKISSDGYNFRLANTTGCPAGAVVTNAGTGYTSAPTVTPSAGGSKWTAIVGGLISGSTTTPVKAGANYTYPPICWIPPPAPGGLQATAHTTISAGAVASVVIDNQGAGYASAPSIYYVSDPNDPNNPVYFPNTSTPITPAGTPTQGLSSFPVGLVGVDPLCLALAAGGTIAAVVCTDPGNAVTSLPTLSFSGGGGASAAATVVMNWTVTGLAVATTGTGFGNAQPVLVLTQGGKTAATPTHTNPLHEQDLTQIRPANISLTSTAGGGLTGTGNIVDGGIGYQDVPNGIVLAGGTGLAVTQGAVTLTVGGTKDTSWLIPTDA